jgi:hypothetical protein
MWKSAYGMNQILFTLGPPELKQALFYSMALVQTLNSIN